MLFIKRLSRFLEDAARFIFLKFVLKASVIGFGLRVGQGAAISSLSKISRLIQVLKQETSEGTKFDLLCLAVVGSREQLISSTTLPLAKPTIIQSNSFACRRAADNHHYFALSAYLWQTIQNFFSPEVKRMFNSGDSKTAQRIESAAAHVKQLFIEFRAGVTERINAFEQKTSAKLQNIHERSNVVFEGGQGLSQESVAELLQAIQKEKSLEWTQNLKTLLEDSIAAVSKTIDSLVDDLQKTVGLEWEQRTHLQNEMALKELKDHLHYHKPADPNYFKFDSQNKHPGVSLSEDGLEGTFKKNMPSRPAAVVVNPIGLDHLRFAFEIKKLQKTAFIFAATTVFIGVCNLSVVKAVGMRRLNEVGKGSYLIGSSGWCYHHKDPKFDRKSIVGFTFGQDEVINVEVQPQEGGRIIFSKEGKIFNYRFELPLGLKEEEISQLRPCLGFDGDEGAVVKILNT